MELAFTQWLQLKWRRAVPSVRVQCALEAGLSGCGVRPAGFRWQLLLGPPPCSLGPTQQCWAEDPEGPYRLAVACRACLAACPPAPFLSLFWRPSLISILTSHSAGPSAPVSHSWEPADTRDCKLRTPGMAEVRATGNRTGRLTCNSIWRNKRTQFQKWVYSEKWSRVHRWIL